VAAILSIIHRISRVIVFVGLLCCLVVSLLYAGEENSPEFTPAESGIERKTIEPLFLNRDEGSRGTPVFGETMQEEDLAPESSEEFSPTPEEEQSRPSVTEEEAVPLDQSPSLLSTQPQSSPFENMPAPLPTPPFMSRPSEWELSPPTVIGMPPLPSSFSFSGQERVAFKFIEEGKENFDRNQWNLAQEQFEQAISLAPFLPYSYYFLGRIALAREDLKSALAFFQKAELLFPRTEQAWLGERTSVKGTVYEERKDYVQARTAYRRSLRFQPANLKVLSALARLPEEEDLSTHAVLQ
jgi:tetratricopeptide (TPR) repeat protein